MDLGYGDAHFARSAGAGRRSRPITRSRSAAQATLPTTCARSGRTSSFAGTVGDDAFAAQVRDLLRGEDVDDVGHFHAARPPDDAQDARRRAQSAGGASRLGIDGAARPETRSPPGGRFRARARPAMRCGHFQRLRQGIALRARSSTPRRSCPLVLADPKPQNIELFSRRYVRCTQCRRGGDDHRRMPIGDDASSGTSRDAR